MSKFKNKYRIESNRLPGWDYSGNGYYFITTVTNGRIDWFGRIENDKMILSDFGKIVKNEWLESFKIRKELFLDVYVIMPNHLHAIVILKKPDLTIVETSDSLVETNGRSSKLKTTLPSQSAGGRSSQLKTTLPSQSLNDRSSQFQAGRFAAHGRAPRPVNPIFQRKPKSISSFMAGYKSATTNKIDDFIDENNLQIEKFNRNNRLWQTNYHDHIIRNKTEYYKIKNYIKNNPSKWQEDKFKVE